MKTGSTVAAALVAGAAAGIPPAAHALPSLPSNPVTPGAMPTPNLGRTGYRVGVFSLGGQAALERSNNEEVSVQSSTGHSILE